MSFNKFTWVDRSSEYPSRRTITDTSTGVSQVATIVRNEGTVTEQGTPFNATNMNSLEDRIDNMFPVSIADGGTGASTNSVARTNLDVYSKSEVDTSFSNLFAVNSDNTGSQQTVVTGGTIYQFCNVNFPSGYNGLLILRAIVVPNQSTDVRIYMGYGLDNADYTEYLQTAALTQSVNDYYINSSIYISSSSSDRTIHGSLSSFSGQDFQFIGGKLQLILFKNF